MKKLGGFSWDGGALHGSRLRTSELGLFRQRIRNSAARRCEKKRSEVPGKNRFNSAERTFRRNLKTLKFIYKLALSVMLSKQSGRIHGRNIDWQVTSFGGGGSVPPLSLKNRTDPRLWLFMCFSNCPRSEITLK